MKILISFLILFISCKDVSHSEICKSNFKVLNIEDYTLGVTFKEFNKKIKNQLIEVKVDDKENILKTFYYLSKFKYKKKWTDIKYIFSFREGLLVSYHFDIMGDRKLFNQMIDDLKDNKLVKDNLKKKLYYSYTEENCNNFIYLIIRNSNICISGGIERDQLPAELSVH